jgi:hypothetical protein
MIESAPVIYKSMNFAEAQMYCLFLEHNGKKGWRIPSIKEVEHIEQHHYMFLNDLPYHVSELAIPYFEKRVLPVRGELE